MKSQAGRHLTSRSALSLSITLALVFLQVILPELDPTLLAADMEPPVVAVVHGTTLTGEAAVAGFATLLAHPLPMDLVLHILNIKKLA